MEAALDVARSRRWSAIVISGDFSQRARPREFERARRILDRFRDLAPVVTVPGNHDTEWWHAPFGIGDADRLHDGYRRWISHELEPTLRLPGVSVVSLNSAWGMLPPALTWYPRDWRVKGGLKDSQLDEAELRVRESAEGDLRLLVVHHNVVRGRLSRRWGMARPQRTLDRIAELGVDVVCTGHDHEERVEAVERSTGKFLLSGANTLSRRVRGHRPTAINVIEATSQTVTVTAWTCTGGSFHADGATASMPRVDVGRGGTSHDVNVGMEGDSEPHAGGAE